MRRFLLIIGFLLLLLVLPEQVSKVLTVSLHDQQHNEYLAYAATQTRNSTTSPHIDPICPTIAQNISSQQSLLTFCSPIYMGTPAGPYGVHITLNGENLPSTPTGWFLRQGQPLKTLSDAQNCTSHSDETCYKLPTPATTQTSSKPQITLFAWIWRDSFPTTQGNYYITATFALSKNQTPILSTSNSFQLLTSQAPCISLNNNPCTFSHQGHPIQINPTKPLTIHGANWILQQNQVDTTEQIQLTASCIKKQSCSQNTATAIVPSSQIDANGAFTFYWTFPISSRGTYHISATNLVRSITNTDNNGTIANQTLSFGTSSDGNGLDITLIPVLPLVSSINIVPFNISAFLIMLPAIVGILAFLFLQGKKSIFAQKIQPIQGRLAIFTPNHQSSTTKPVIYNNSYTQFDDWEHKQIIASFPLQIARVHDIPPGKQNPDLDKNIWQAIKCAKNQKDPQQAIYLASHFLITNLDYWEALRKELIKPFSISSEQLEQWEQLGIKATFAIQNEKNPDQKRLYCSTALVYYTLYLSHQTPVSIKDAHIHFDMGFAYLNLAMLGSKNTIFQLLKKAQESYNKALHIYEKVAQWHLVARTHIALGDIQFAHASRNDANATNYRNHTRQFYQSAQEIYQHQNTMQDIELEQAIRLRRNGYER